MVNNTQMKFEISSLTQQEFRKNLNQHTMKKLALLLLCITTLGLASCKKDTIVSEKNPNYTFYASIQPNRWIAQTDSEGSYYYADITNSEIERYEDDGTIVSFQRFNDNGYDALPFTLGMVRYSYTSYPGRIRVYLQDHYNQDILPARPTSEISARVVIVASSSN